MKSEILAGSPIIIAALATIVAIAGSGRDGRAPHASEQPVVVSAPDEAAQVPLIGELTVTARRG